MEIPSLLPPASANPVQQDLIAAEAAVRAYCGWHIAPVITEDIVLDGSGTSSLFIKTLRLKNIVSAEASGTVLDPETLEWSEAGFLRTPGVWPDRLRSVKLTIEHGFDDAPDVAAIIRAVAARASASPGGVVREQLGGRAVSLSMVAPGVAGGIVLMEHERRPLDRYRVSGRP